MPAQDGRLTVPIASPLARPPHLVRLLTWLPWGVALGTVRRRSPRLLKNLGGAVARLDLALDGFDHPAIDREFYWDLASA